MIDVPIGTSTRYLKINYRLKPFKVLVLQFFEDIIYK